MSKYIRMSISVPEDIHEAIKASARAEDRSMSSWILRRLSKQDTLPAGIGVPLPNPLFKGVVVPTIKKGVVVPAPAPVPPPKQEITKITQSRLDELHPIMRDNMLIHIAAGKMVVIQDKETPTPTPEIAPETPTIAPETPTIAPE